MYGFAAADLSGLSLPDAPCEHTDIRGETEKSDKRLSAADYGRGQVSGPGISGLSISARTSDITLRSLSERRLRIWYRLSRERL